LERRYNNVSFGLGCLMKPRYFPALGVCLLFSVVLAGADDQKAPSLSGHLSKQDRMDIIRTFTQDLVYIRAAFPMGKTGLSVKDGAVSPSGAQLQQMMAMWGPAVKPGDQAMITRVTFKNDRIRFEINGGPIKKQKWYQRIEVGGMGGMGPVAPSDPGANPRGSFVDLVFDHDIPDVNPVQLQGLLNPVFDFHSKSALEAYLETVPPKVKEAIQSHRVLVGMNRGMVIYSKGRAPKKDREKDGDAEYEEWIYGDPPEDVDFVRFVGDEVVRVETMKVTGQRVVRTEKEVNLQPQPSVAKGDEPDARPAGAPSLRRPGEAPDTSAPVNGSNPNVPVSPPASPPTGSGSPPD